MNFLELIKEFGLIAGIAGISVGVLLYLFRNIISIKILSILTKKQAFAVIITFMILVFTVSIYSIYQYGEINKISNDEGKSKPKTEVENSEITEEINETVPEEAENLYLINKEGVGRFKLGNNLSQVTLPDNWSINKINKLYPAEGNLLKKPEFIVKNQDGDDWLHIKTTNILYSKTNNHEYDTNTLNEYISSDTISEIELIDPRIKTSRGLNSNSSIIDVKRLYPFSEFYFYELDYDDAESYIHIDLPNQPFRAEIDKNDVIKLGAKILDISDFTKGTKVSRIYVTNL